MLHRLGGGVEGRSQRRRGSLTEKPCAARSTGPADRGISAWSSSQRLVLWQRQVDGKSNEITAIRELLDLLAIEGAVVTIDAMGCQRDIAAKISAKGADYVFSLKGNQVSLRDEVELFFDEQSERDYIDTTIIPKTVDISSQGRGLPP